MRQLGKKILPASISPQCRNQALRLPSWRWVTNLHEHEILSLLRLVVWCRYLKNKSSFLLLLLACLMGERISSPVFSISSRSSIKYGHYCGWELNMWNTNSTNKLLWELIRGVSLQTRNRTQWVKKKKCILYSSLARVKVNNNIGIWSCSLRGWWHNILSIPLLWNWRALQMSSKLQMLEF